MKSIAKEIFLIFIASFILFTWGLYPQEIIGFDSRFYLFAQEMLQDGISWFPTTYHLPYPDYPASSTIIIYVLSNLFGTLNKLIAVIPTALLSAITLVMTYLVGSLDSKRWGICAVFFILLTSMFINSARSISLDLYPTAITVTCFYLLASADRFNFPRRIVWIYPLLFLGFAFRGPIGLVIPAGVICAYYLINKNFYRLVIFSLSAFILLALCTVLLLALAYYADGYAFMQNVLKMEILGRMNNPFLPRYFYFTNSFGNYALAFPFACLVLFGIRKNQRLLQLAGWMLVVLIGMSIPDDKKVRYILPMVPAIALLASYPFIASEKEKFYVFLRKLMTGFFAIFPSIILFAIIAASFYIKKPAITVEINFYLLAAIFFILQIINIIFMMPLRNREYILGVSALCFILLNYTIVEPIRLSMDKARDFVASIEAKREEENASLIFFREQPDGVPIKYLINMRRQVLPLFMNDNKQIINFTKPAYFITSEVYFKQLAKTMRSQLEIIDENSLGHNDVVVFRLSKKLRG